MLFRSNKGEQIAVDGSMGKNTVEALNKLTKNSKMEVQLVKDLTAKRLSTLQSLPDFSWAGKAWTRRLYEIQDQALKYITENPAKTTGGVLGILLLGAGIYYLSKGTLPKIG